MVESAGMWRRSLDAARTLPEWTQRVPAAGHCRHRRVPGTQSTHYLTRPNLTNLLQQMTPVGIASLGTTLLIVGGYVDLSIGSMFGLAAVVAALLSRVMNPALAIVLAVVLTAAGRPDQRHPGLANQDFADHRDPGQPDAGSSRRPVAHPGRGGGRRA